MWARERKNARNSITNVVSLSISKVIPLLVLEIQEDMEKREMAILPAEAMLPL